MEGCTQGGGWCRVAWPGSSIRVTMTQDPGPRTQDSQIQDSQIQDSQNPDSQNPDSDLRNLMTRTRISEIS